MVEWMDTIKLTFCRYVTAIFLHAIDDREIDIQLDKIINFNFEDDIIGDCDLKEVILFTINLRKMERHLIVQKPRLGNMVLLKAFMKSLFL